MLIDDIALTMYPRIGPRTAVHLLDCFGDAGYIFNSTVEELTRMAELREDLAKALLAKKYHGQAEKELNFCRKNGILPVVSTSAEYPSLLRECRDYPHVLYVRGDVRVFDKPMLSIVGTRSQTQYGRKMCENIIGELAELFPDLTVVSGLAYGTDGMCHRIALANGLRSIGVMATGADRVHPVQHASMALKMVETGGALITECHSGSGGSRNMFIARNRIIAGLTPGTLVTESALKGGSMITANLADSYDRCVMALPGRVDDVFSEGTNLLIRTQRARMVRNAADIAYELDWEPARVSPPKQVAVEIDPQQKSILDLLEDGKRMTIDELSDRSGISAPELSAILLGMEMEGLLRVWPGMIYERK